MRHEKCLDKCFAWLTNAESNVALPFRFRTLHRRTYQAAIRRPPVPGTFVCKSITKVGKGLEGAGVWGAQPQSMKPSEWVRCKALRMRTTGVY